MLDTVDQSRSLSKDEYVQDLICYQVALSRLGYQVYVQQRPVILVFEGWDAAGKGGVIKRVTEKLDPRGYVVHPIAAPSGEDKTHHYLWRFWRRLPERGQIAIFDRSWYGRVMVERIEGFASEEEWRRAYREINQFERQLVDFGTILFKFWIHISRDEQLQRFELRKDTAYKSWKLTDEDWRNRDKWDRYEAAVDEMLRRTSTLTAPWTVVEGNCKWFARVRVLKTVVDGMSQELNFDPFSDMPPLGKKKPKKKARERQSPAGEPARSLPMIDDFAHGTIVIDGRDYECDVMILPDGTVKAWQPEDGQALLARHLKPVLKARPEVVVIGTGTVGSLSLHPKAEKRLEHAGVEILAYRTHKACETYRQLRSQCKLAALLHVTS